MNQVRIAALSDFAGLVENLGGNAEEILHEHGLSRAFIENTSVDSYMPYEQAEAIYQSAATATGCAHFGMLLGKKSGIKLLGTVGYLMLQSAQVESALEVLCNHFSFHVPDAAVIEWRIEGNFVAITYRIIKPMKVVNQGVELAIANLLSFFRHVNGEEWYPTAVNFAHQKPDNLRPYHHFFGPNISFDQEENTFIFRNDFLKTVIELKEPALKKILESHLEQSTVKSQINLSGIVTSRIRQNLPLGRASIKFISAGLFLNSRSLHRMLAKEDTSFSALLDSTRRFIALEKIQHSNISMVRLALHLGYSDTSAFTRAFKRWSGVSPTVWKAKHKCT